MEKLSIDTSYEYFYENFLLKNVPCIFEQKLTLNWRSRHEWVLPDGCPNLHYLRDAFGILPIDFKSFRLNNGRSISNCHLCSKF